jgi:hypothetical protein
MIKIYTLSNPLTDEIRYVGITAGTLNHRLAQHICETRNNKRTCWIKNLKNNNLLPKIELLDIVSKNEWANEEKFYISYFRYIGLRLINMTEGGDRIEMTPEIRNKIRIKRLNYKCSDETKNKIRIANLEGRCGTKGVKQTPQHIEKRASAKRGVKWNMESRLKLSRSTHKKPILQYDLNGIFINEFESITKCCEINNWSKGNIIKVCKNIIRKDGSKCKTAYGFVWKYKNNEKD